MKNYDLGTEKIGRLVRHFSVPCVISMLVAALYNIVDQIFIGWSSAGAFGNAIAVFIFAFNMGVKGAAIATVIGQALTFVMSMTYLF